MSAKEEKPEQLKLAIDSPEARLLADLTGILRDLARVMAACRAIQSRSGPGNDHIRKACFDSAVMRYRRCFNTGKRTKYEADMASVLTVDELALHEKVLRLADKSVAHCVDGSEENITYVTVSIMPDGSFQANISVHSGIVLHHEKVGADRFEALARRLHEIVQGEANATAQKVLDQFRALSPGERHSLPRLTRAITDEGEEIFEKYGGTGARLQPRE